MTTLRVLLLREIGWWVAQCVDHDLAAQARTETGALQALGHAIVARNIIAQVAAYTPPFLPAPPVWYAEEWARGEIHSTWRNGPCTMDVHIRAEWG